MTQDNPLLESDEAILRRQLRAVFRQDAIPATMMAHIFVCCAKPGVADVVKILSGTGYLYGFKLTELGLKWVSVHDYDDSTGNVKRPCYIVKHREKLITKVMELFKPEYAAILELEFGAASLIKSGV